ncbi:MAG TPA: ABC transporter permease [Jatrophihabitantaceae bacterium]|jgi:peptide/nickel transport system permease protein
MAAPLGQIELDADAAESVEGPQVVEKAVAGRSPAQIAWRRLRHDTVSMIALVMCILFALLAIAAPFMASAKILQPYTFHNNLIGGLGSMPTGGWGGIGWSHWFGVEPQTGRDVFSRVVLGVSFSLLIATTATLLSVLIGGTLGIISGYMGRSTDFWISRFMDLILCFPQTLMLLALSPVLKQRITDLGVPAGTPTSAVYLILVLGFFSGPYFGRIMRGQVLSLRNREFVEAARSLGASRRRIWVRELLPNLWAPLIVFASLTLPLNVSAEAALSFLGVGLQAPTPSLGNILFNSVNFYSADPAFFYLPGITLVLIVLSFNLLGDGLRDALDPKSTR